jgi:hypothetical protein
MFNLIMQVLVPSIKHLWFVSNTIPYRVIYIYIYIYLSSLIYCIQLLNAYVFRNVCYISWLPCLVKIGCHLNQIAKFAKIWNTWLQNWITCMYTPGNGIMMIRKCSLYKLKIFNFISLMWSLPYEQSVHSKLFE